MKKAIISVLVLVLVTAGAFAVYFGAHKSNDKISKQDASAIVDIDENDFETVSLSLNEDEHQRLIAAKKSEIDFGNSDLVKDIYDKILEINKNNDYDYYISYPETAVNAMNYMLYFIEREKIVCSDLKPSEASIKKFVEEIYRRIDYPEL